jgi:hypothetical protein
MLPEMASTMSAREGDSVRASSAWAARIMPGVQ